MGFLKSTSKVFGIVITTLAVILLFLNILAFQLEKTTQTPFQEQLVDYLIEHNYPELTQELGNLTKEELKAELYNEENLEAPDFVLDADALRRGLIIMGLVLVIGILLLIGGSTSLFHFGKILSIALLIGSILTVTLCIAARIVLTILLNTLHGQGELPPFFITAIQQVAAQAIFTPLLQTLIIAGITCGIAILSLILFWKLTSQNDAHEKKNQSNKQ